MRPPANGALLCLFETVEECTDWCLKQTSLKDIVAGMVLLSGSSLRHNDLYQITALGTTMQKTLANIFTLYT